MFFPDNREKFRHVYQWDVPDSIESETPAKRTADEWEQVNGKWQLKDGSRQPRRDFRKTTANPVPPAPSGPTTSELPQKLQSQSYLNKSESKSEPYAPQTASTSQASYLAAAEVLGENA